MSAWQGSAHSCARSAKRPSTRRTRWVCTWRSTVGTSPTSVATAAPPSPSGATSRPTSSAPTTTTCWMRWTAPKVLRPWPRSTAAACSQGWKWCRVQLVAAREGRRVWRVEWRGTCIWMTWPTFCDAAGGGRRFLASEENQLVNICKDPWTAAKACGHQLVNICRNLWTAEKSGRWLQKLVDSHNCLWTAAKTCQQLQWDCGQLKRYVYSREEKTCELPCRFVNCHKDSWTVMKICELPWRFVKCHEDLWTVMKICELPRRFAASCKGLQWRRACGQQQRLVEGGKDVWTTTKACG